jgi:cupin superfamily acireductone dioxygenase involved in methionine salvage
MVLWIYKEKTANQQSDHRKPELATSMVLFASWTAHAIRQVKTGKSEGYI